MADFTSVIVECYEHFQSCACFRKYSDTAPDSNSVYMSIPLQETSVEIPVFALNSLYHTSQMVDITNKDALVIKLEYKNHRTSYKSVDAKMREALATKYPQSKLMSIPDGDRPNAYFGTYGAVFSRDYKPIMMLMWEFKKVEVENTVKYEFARPIMRVSPSVVINKSNAIERCIVNKMIPAALSARTIYFPYGTFPYIKRRNDDSDSPIKVIIDKFPYDMRKVDKPSISTTNDELIKLALDNINEVIQ